MYTKKSTSGIKEDHTLDYTDLCWQRKASAFQSGDSLVKKPPAVLETQVGSLILKEPTCLGATKPVSHNY